MLNQVYPYYVANRAIQANTELEVIDKYSGEVATRVALADETTVKVAIGAAVQAAKPMRELKGYQRQRVLEHCTKRFVERTEELATALCIEAGKPIRDARGEVGRLIETFRVASEEAVRQSGEVLPLDISPRTGNYSGGWLRVPIGPCSFITPFNFPLNLVAHKVAPAIAAGCPFVLKPASATPVGALIIAEVLAETELPEGAFSVLPCRREAARPFSEDSRVKLLSFTGSAEAGWALKAKAGKKRVVLELGGNAACIVDETADLEDAIERLVVGAFYQSGQSCVSVQRILLHESIYQAVAAKLTEKVRNLRTGDPRNENTFIGPLISEQAAARLETLIRTAVEDGAKILCGGDRKGALLQPTLIEQVSRTQPLRNEEAFGPVAILSAFDDFDTALAEANDTEYGLQAGVFTRDIYRAKRAWHTLEVGSVLIGEVPSFRADHMPYGGVKNSGLGREGLRFAMEEMTEPRMLVLRTPDREA